jgi:hypothetical protein
VVSPSLRRGSHDDSWRWGRLSRWCRRRPRAANGLAGGAGHLDVDSIVALLTLKLAIVFVLFATVARRWFFGLGLWLWSGWCGPARDLPDDAGKALEREAALLPFAAGLARPIEGSQASIDGTLIGLGAEFMSRCRCIRCPGSSAAVVDGTILPVIKLVIVRDNRPG